MIIYGYALFISFGGTMTRHVSAYQLNFCFYRDIKTFASGISFFLFNKALVGKS